MKLYALKDSVTAYMEEYWTCDKEYEGVTVEEQKTISGTNMFYCIPNGETGEKGEGTCGKHCAWYIPRNGKSGYCKESRGPLEGTGKFYKIIDQKFVRVKCHT